MPPGSKASHTLLPDPIVISFCAPLPFLPRTSLGCQKCSLKAAIHDFYITKCESLQKAPKITVKTLLCPKRYTQNLLEVLNKYLNVPQWLVHT